MSGTESIKLYSSDDDESSCDEIDAVDDDDYSDSEASELTWHELHEIITRENVVINDDILDRVVDSMGEFETCDVNLWIYGMIAFVMYKHKMNYVDAKEYIKINI
jgi:hypothetical protein